MSDTKNYSCETCVRYLSGVGEKRAESLAKLGIKTLGDLVCHFPRAYQDRGDIREIASAPVDEIHSFILTCSTGVVSARLRGNMVLSKLSAFDESGKCDIVFFNQPYVKDVFTVGSTFRFYGKLSQGRYKRELICPKYEPYFEGAKLSDLVPVYPLTEGINQKYLTKIISTALSEISDFSEINVLNGYIEEEYALPDTESTVRSIHQPKNSAELGQAKRRIIFEQLYIFALGVLLSKKKIQKGKAPVFSVTDTSLLERKLPYTLTNAQKRVISEIKKDVSSKDCIPMSRLVAGDVGSGKTVCAAAACYIALANGFQSAIMAPTEILARQHYSDLKPLFASLGYECELLVGSTPGKKKSEIKKRLADGTLPLVIGTHALITSDVSFARAGLFVTDEQHRFGVLQRASLADKGRNAHILVMSATPIPRTLALILYGDLSLSQLDEMPPGRQRVSTFLIDESYRARLNGFIEKQVKQGRQVYIVCPAIEGEEDDAQSTEKERRRAGIKYAVDYEKQLRGKISPDIKTALMHGKLKSSEKEKIMSDFAEGRTQVLVSTTVIEVGVNVPNATLMIVENAERFGLSQLHQLRGRVGRGKHKSFCILVSDTKTEEALERLKVMTETNDGYVIAQRDLQQRGPGDFFPSNSGRARQSGSAEFCFAQNADMNVLREAFECAAHTLTLDENLEKKENLNARKMLSRLFDIHGNTMN